MAADSPRQSIYLNSSRKPRQLPALPRLQQMPSNDQRSPIQGQSRNKSPGTPLVFEFPPPEYNAETPNTNFDFDEFRRVGEQQRSPRSPSFYARTSPRSPKTPNSDIIHSPGRKSPFSQFSDLCENSKQTKSYPTMVTERCRSASYSQSCPKPFDRRRNSCFGTLNLKSPMSPTIPIVIPSSPDCESMDSKVDRRLETDDKDIFEEIVEHKAKIRGKTSSLESPLGKRETASEGGERRFRQRSRSIKMDIHVNKSQGCLDEVGRGHRNELEEYSSRGRGEKNMSRRSTSDLTDMDDVDTETTTLLSSPRRKSSMKSGLAYLASRRSSRDSQCSNMSNVSNEDVGPLNFSSHPRGRQRRTSNFLEIPVPNHIKPRVHSLPEKAFNPRESDDLYRLRAFSITHKGVVNQGDCIKSRRSRSNTSVNSSRNSNVSGERSPFDGSCCSGQGASTDGSDIEEISKYRVVMFGESGVGKSSLVSQFTTSEYINTYDASLDEEFGEKTVSVLLDGQESEMVFIDHPYVEMSVENSLSTYEPHGCIVVYSVVSRTSFQVANEILSYLWRENYTKDRSVILVGNKSDLARSRTISEDEGKQLATSHECKFIETSSGIKHNVDELLVGILKQIRLRESRKKKLQRQNSKNKMLSKLYNSKTVLNLNLAREILNKMCLKDSKSKSCENLHIL